MGDGLSHFTKLFRVVVNPVEQTNRDDELYDGKNDFLHRAAFASCRSGSYLRSGNPKCLLQTSTERLISSAVFRGLISQTQAQSFGSSGTSFSRSTSPA